MQCGTGSSGLSALRPTRPAGEVSANSAGAPEQVGLEQRHGGHHARLAPRRVPVQLQVGGDHACARSVWERSGALARAQHEGRGQVQSPVTNGQGGLDAGCFRQSTACGMGLGKAHLVCRQRACVGGKRLAVLTSSGDGRAYSAAVQVWNVTGATWRFSASGGGLAGAPVTFSVSAAVPAPQQ